MRMKIEKGKHLKLNSFSAMMTKVSQILSRAEKDLSI